MNSHTLLFILLIHFLADFGLQTHEQATGKGVGMKLVNKELLQHVGVYSLVWFIATFILTSSLFSAFIFALVTFCVHYFTDYITSRISKPFFAKGDYHNGFVVIGADQMLHYIQLYLTYQFLFQ